MSEDNKQIKILKEMLKWIKVSGINNVKPVLEEEFKDDVKKQVYQLSEGTKGTQEIAKIVGTVKYVTIFNYWKSWEKLGLGEYNTIPGGKRFQRSFDLEDFGIKVPKITNQETKQKSGSEQIQEKQEVNSD